MQEGLAQLRNRLFRKSPLLQPASDLVASAIELTNAPKSFKLNTLHISGGVRFPYQIDSDERESDRAYFESEYN